MIETVVREAPLTEIHHTDTVLKFTCYVKENVSVLSLGRLKFLLLQTKVDVPSGPSFCANVFHLQLRQRS